MIECTYVHISDSKIICFSAADYTQTYRSVLSATMCVASNHTWLVGLKN